MCQGTAKRVELLGTLPCPLRRESWLRLDLPHKNGPLHLLSLYRLGARLRLRRDR